MKGSYCKELVNHVPFHESVTNPVTNKRESYCSVCRAYFTTVVENSGGPNKKYDVPANAKILQDLIEHKQMNFAIGNMFKACYRLGDPQNPDMKRDLEKIIFFAERELDLL